MEPFRVRNNEPEPFDSKSRLEAKIAVCGEQLADLADAEKKLEGHKVVRWFAIFRDDIDDTKTKLQNAKKGLDLIAKMSLEDIEEALERVSDTTSAKYSGVSPDRFRVLQLEFAASELRARPTKRVKLQN